jgi:hypothetical protein
MRAFLVVAVLLAAGAAGAAEAPPATCFAHPERWAYDRGKETLAAPGERFFEDLRACDATFAAAVAEAVRYQIQADEAEKFVRSKDTVLLAYGIAWGVLAVSGLLLWLRQRRLLAEIASLEARLKAVGESS